MARKKITKKTAKKCEPKKAANRRVPAATGPTEMLAGGKSVKPFEVCNHFGMYLREVFEKEYSQNRGVQLGQVFEYLLRELQGAWDMVNLYGKETPLEKLRGESKPFHYDR